MSEPAGDSDADGENGVSPPPSAPAYRGVAITLAVALLLLAALAGTAPFWAPSLPWVPRSASDPRIERIEHALQQLRQDETATTAATRQLGQRVAALEAKPAPPPADTAELTQQLATLSTGAAKLAARLEALDQAMQAQAKASADLGRRVEALEQAAHRATASGSSDTAILLVLLQLRDALAAGQPFAAAYDALTMAARNRPLLIAAAAPLAGPAKSGVMTRAGLAERLRQLAPAIAKAAPAEKAGAGSAASGWRGRLLDRLRGLVRVRRIDGGPLPQGDLAPVDTAERALASGDLQAAVTVIEKLHGGAADAARPWLQSAKERLAAERALQQVEERLAADLGAAAKPADAAGSTP